MATGKLTRPVSRLALLAAICAYFALFGQGRVPVSQAVYGQPEQYLQADDNTYAYGAVAASMYIQARGSYNIPYNDCTFVVYDWTGVTEGYYNHFGQIGFQQYDTNPQCPSVGAPAGWNPYGFSIRAEAAVDSDTSGYLACNYGAMPIPAGQDSAGYHFACFIPFSTLGFVADHEYNWTVNLHYNDVPICVPYGCYGD